MANPEYVIEEVPFTGEVAEVMRPVPRDSVPDITDRIVAATALYFGAPVISHDSRIRAPSLHLVNKTARLGLES